MLINPDFLENDKLCFLSKITGIGEIRAHLFKNVLSHPFISQNQTLRTQSKNVRFSSLVPFLCLYAFFALVYSIDLSNKDLPLVDKTETNIPTKQDVWRDKSTTVNSEIKQMDAILKLEGRLLTLEKKSVTKKTQLLS